MVTGYCASVRSALTDDGGPPLIFAGLRLHQNLVDIYSSVQRNAEKGGLKPLGRSRDILGRALERTAAIWPEVKLGASWVQGASAILAHGDELSAELVSHRYLDRFRKDPNAYLAELETACHKLNLPSQFFSIALSGARRDLPK